MRATRRFLPSSIAGLEGRVVLSQAGPARRFPSPPSCGRSVFHPPRSAQSNASEQSFPMSVSDTIHSGQPVAEQVTIKYNDGSSETQSVLESPTRQTTPSRSTGRSICATTVVPKKMVDTESFSGGTTPFSGTKNTQVITITLPNASSESETYQDVVTGKKTIENGTLDEAGGGVETWTSVAVKHGSVTTTNKTITEPDGTVEQQKTVTTHYGELDSTAINDNPHSFEVGDPLFVIGDKHHPDSAAGLKEQRLRISVHIVSGPRIPQINADR